MADDRKNVTYRLSEDRLKQLKMWALENDTSLQKMIDAGLDLLMAGAVMGPDVDSGAVSPADRAYLGRALQFRRATNPEVSKHLEGLFAEIQELLGDPADGKSEVEGLIDDAERELKAG